MPSWRGHSHHLFQLALGGYPLNGKFMSQILVKMRNKKKETYVDRTDRPQAESQDSISQTQNLLGTSQNPIKFMPNTRATRGATATQPSSSAAARSGLMKNAAGTTSDEGSSTSLATMTPTLATATRHACSRAGSEDAIDVDLDPPCPIWHRIL